MPNPLLLPLLLAAYVVSTLIVADIIRATIRHYSKGNDLHPMPLPIHQAFVVAIFEVCWDRPRSFHRSRMAVVHRAEERRLNAMRAARLRHPANYRAHEHAIKNNPCAATHSIPGHPAQAVTMRRVAEPVEIPMPHRGDTHIVQGA